MNNRGDAKTKVQANVANLTAWRERRLRLCR